MASHTNCILLQYGNETDDKQVQQEEGQATYILVANVYISFTMNVKGEVGSVSTKNLEEKFVRQTK